MHARAGHTALAHLRACYSLRHMCPRGPQPQPSFRSRSAVVRLRTPLYFSYHIPIPFAQYDMHISCARFVLLSASVPLRLRVYILRADSCIASGPFVTTSGPSPHLSRARPWTLPRSAQSRKVSPFFRGHATWPPRGWLRTPSPFSFESCLVPPPFPFPSRSCPLTTSEVGSWAVFRLPPFGVVRCASASARRFLL
ncbi:hypothetical protein B0H13DRAFT_2003519 [Mycena leptocephala]|nr:hypothetical protein B0H13DRAFT_2003519 [Mycena leptocephala]